MKDIILIAVALSVLSFSALAQEDLGIPMTPEEEFYSGDPINGDLSELPPEESYYQEMERQEEWTGEEYPADDLEWDTEESMNDVYFEEY